MSNPAVRFWNELKRRKVIRVVIAYGIIGWVIIEVSSVILPALLLPEWSHRLVIVLVALGFPAALILAWVFELSPEGLKRESGAADDAAQALLPSGIAPTKPANTLLTDARRSIVVLPFTNLSAENGSEFFSDGITEEVLSLLSRQPDLRVVSRTTSFSFKNSQLAVREIADRLNVEMVLEGSVRRADRKLRIMAQLIDPVTDTQVWSNQYDRELTDVFAVQGEIARCIVDALDLDPGACPDCAPPTREIEAYDYYLRGRQYVHMLTQTSLEFARQMFRNAIEIDPAYAQAWAGLADTESLVATWYEHTPERIAAANEASEKALALAPSLAETHSARGHALTIDGHFEAAAKAFEHALQLEPGNYNALYLYGRSRFAEGKAREAAELFQQAHQAQPDEFTAIALLSNVLSSLGQLDVYQQARDEAIRLVEQQLELNPDDQRALHFGCGLMIDAGRVDEGLDMIDRLLRLSPNDGTALYNAACAYARGGMTEQALDLLERRMAQGWINLDWLENDSDLDSVREHPRYLAMLRKLVGQQRSQ
jgi:adenylate cyclase